MKNQIKKSLENISRRSATPSGRSRLSYFNYSKIASKGIKLNFINYPAHKLSTRTTVQLKLILRGNTRLKATYQVFNKQFRKTTASAFKNKKVVWNTPENGLTEIEKMYGAKPSLGVDFSSSESDFVEQIASYNKVNGHAVMTIIEESTSYTPEEWAKIKERFLNRNSSVSDAITRLGNSGIVSAHSLNLFAQSFNNVTLSEDEQKAIEDSAKRAEQAAKSLRERLNIDDHGKAH